MTRMIAPLYWKTSSIDHDGNPKSDTRVTILNARNEVITEILPGQIMGQVPTYEDRAEIATALCNAFNLVERAKERSHKLTAKEPSHVDNSSDPRPRY